MTDNRIAFRIDERPGTLWGHVRTLVRDTVVPYQWEALNDRVADAEPSHALRNFRIAAGREAGEFHGFVFQDSDVGKWIEAAAESLADRPDADLERRIDETVELMAAAQQPDGYLNTYYQVKEPGRRFTNLGECHELYSAGHLLEGALAYFEATGKRAFLDVMLKYVALIDATFGPRPGQIRGYDGHEEIELALLRLYRVTGDRRHLDLARFFLDERGRQPAFFRQEWEARGRVSHWTGRPSDSPPDGAYTQSHLPVREQTEVVGHAVRAVYLLTALADLARLDADAELAAVCRRLWDDLVHRKLYVTGTLGSTHHGEALTVPFDLPAETGYAETCASVGLVFFAERMLALNPAAEYADTIETALYNGVLASMAADGRSFFYVNPQESIPAFASNPDRHHVKTQRQKWFSCACCPPNLARLVLSFGRYVVAADDREVRLDHYISGTASLPGGVTLTVETGYPFSGDVTVTLDGALAGGTALALRAPGWCTGATAVRDGRPVPLLSDARGYWLLTGPWEATTSIELNLPLPPVVLEARREVRSAAGKVALRRGPVVYAFEEADNGAPLAGLEVDDRARVEVVGVDLPAGAVSLRVRGRRQPLGGPLYRPVTAPGESVFLTAVPYFLWGNRGHGEMSVWMNRG